MRALVSPLRTTRRVCWGPQGSEEPYLELAQICMDIAEEIKPLCSCPEPGPPVCCHQPFLPANAATKVPMEFRKAYPGNVHPRGNCGGNGAP